MKIWRNKSIHIDWTNEQPNSRDSQQTVTHFRESKLRGACVSVTLWSDDLARSPPPSDLNTVSRLFRSYELVINFLSLSAKLIHINLFKGLGCGVLLLVPTAQIRAIHQSHVRLPRCCVMGEITFDHFIMYNINHRWTFLCLDSNNRIIPWVEECHQQKWPTLNNLTNVEHRA